MMTFETFRKGVNMTKTSNEETILKTIKRGPRKGLTAAQIAERAKLKESSTRTILWSLSQAGAVARVGAVNTGSAGRPSYLYVVA